MKNTSVVKIIPVEDLTPDENCNSAEIFTQYPLQTSYSSFKESESSGLYSSEEESGSVAHKTRSRLKNLSSFHSKSKNDEKSVVSPLVFYEETLKDSTLNKTQQVKGVVDYDNTVNQIFDQSVLNETQSPSPSKKLVPYEKSMATMSEVSPKTSPLVPYDKTSATVFHDDTFTYDETLPSFSETFKDKPPALVAYDKTSSTIIVHDSTLPNIVGYDTTLHPGDESELTKSNINLVPYENTMVHKTPKNKTSTTISDDNQELDNSFEAEPSPIVSKEQQCNKTTYTTDGSTFDEMSAFENPNATGLMVGNIKYVSLYFFNELTLQSQHIGLVYCLFNCYVCSTII